MDAYHYYVPSYSYTAQSLAGFRIPLWNPHQMCGAPYLAALQGAVFYPPILLFAALPSGKAYSIYWMAHAVMGGVFIIVLCRRLKLSWIASLAGAGAFMFCSNTASKLFGPAFLANSVYLPLMFVFVLKIFETGRPKWAVALAMGVLAPLLAGWIQALVYSLYALCIFVVAIVVRSLVKKTEEVMFVKRGLALLAFSVALFLLLSAAQTLPVIEMGRMATRSFGEISEEMLTIRNSAIYSPYRILHDSLNSKGGILPFYLYMGILPLLFSIMALWEKRLRFYVLFFYGMSACALILSMGPQTPFYKLWSYLPMMKIFRAPFRFLFLHAVSVSVLCGIGLDRFLRWFDSYGERDGKTMAIAAVVVAVVSGTLILAWPETGAHASRAIKLLAAASNWQFYLTALAILAIVLRVSPGPAHWKPHALGIGCFVLILVDLFAANHNYFYLPEKNPSIYEKHSRVIEKIKSETDTDNARVFVVADLLDFSYCIKLGQLTGLSLINDYENMNPRRYNRYCNHIFGKEDERSAEFFWGWFNLDEKLVHRELLNYMSAKYLWFSRDYLSRANQDVIDNYTKLTESSSPIYADETDMVFVNPDALPRAYIVGKSRLVSDEEEILRLLTSDDFSPTEEVILSDGPQRGEEDSIRAARRSSAIIKSLEPEKIIIETNMEDDGFLVLTDQYYPGWEASVDGEEVDIYRANYLFRCVPAPAGRHEVVFRFRPTSFRLGVALSCVGTLALAAFCAAPAVRRLKRAGAGRD